MFQQFRLAITVNLMICKSQYAADNDFARVYKQLSDGVRHEHYLLRDGFLMMHGKLCVTKQLRSNVLIKSHAPPYAGHVVSMLHSRIQVTTQSERAQNTSIQHVVINLQV